MSSIVPSSWPALGAIAVPTVLAGAAWFAMPSSAQSPFEVEEVRRNVRVFRGEGGNTTALLARNGIVLVDAKTVRSGRKLRDAVRALARERGDERSVRLLVLTHHHPDQSGGRGVFDEALVVTSDQASERLGSADGLATMGFTTRTTFRLPGGEVVTCHHKGAAHTDGDVIVHFSKARVLCVGGLVANGLHPAVVLEHGADVRSWIRILRELRRDFGDDDGLIVVPGDGPSGGPEILDAQIDYLQRIIDLVDDALRRGQSLDELLDRAQTLRDANEGIRGDRGHFERTLRALHGAG